MQYNAINDWLSTITLMMKDIFQHTKNTHTTFLKVFIILLAHWASNETLQWYKGQARFPVNCSYISRSANFCWPSGSATNIWLTLWASHRSCAAGGHP